MKGPNFFKGEIITKKQKYIDEIKKSSSPEPLGHLTKLGTKHPRVKGIQVCSNEEPFNFHSDNYGGFLVLINVMI